jgi:hypothetical protein
MFACLPNTPPIANQRCSHRSRRPGLTGRAEPSSRPRPPDLGNRPIGAASARSPCGAWRRPAGVYARAWAGKLELLSPVPPSLGMAARGVRNAADVEAPPRRPQSLRPRRCCPFRSPPLELCSAAESAERGVPASTIARPKRPQRSRRTAATGGAWRIIRPTFDGLMYRHRHAGNRACHGLPRGRSLRAARSYLQKGIWLRPVAFDIERPASLVAV